MARIQGGLHLDDGDTFTHRFYMAPDTVGCVLKFGEVPVYFRSAAQMTEAILAMRLASEAWESELLMARRPGYVLAPYETPESHRAAIHDDGCDHQVVS